MSAEKEKQEEFEKVIEQTVESEQEEQDTKDAIAFEEVITGAQEIVIKGYGSLIFENPTPRLLFMAERAASLFKTKHLQRRDLLTKDALKKIYGQPVKMEIKGVETIVGTGEWTEKEERALDELPKQADLKKEKFELFREDLQNRKLELDSAKGKNKDKLQKEYNIVYKNAQQKYEEMLELKTKIMDLQLKSFVLFGECLEEQAFFEKVKILAPSCIKLKKEDGTIDKLWRNEDDMLDDARNPLGATQTISLFSLFLRGVSVDFLAGSLEKGQTL